ncbi:glycosyltransferase involved in cell wall biosynthesis [Comamonas sp. JUb58]|nr:glycosyltransferase involved in cell wall biosynthesis [Comamonas sp. JUb58]
MIDILKHPLISIALATYNGERFLEQQMDSLLAQDYQNLEIVISDDCSTDGTWGILQAYAAKDSRIRLLVRDVNRGYVGNFIRVFMQCKGDFISPSDQDDIWHSNKTRRLVESIGDADLAYCNNRFIDDTNTPLGKKYSDTVSKMVSGKDPRNLIFCTSISGHAMIFRSNLLQITENLSTASYIDWLIAFLAANRNGINYIDEILVDWRQHQSSATFRFRKNTHGAKAEGIVKDKNTFTALAAIPGKHQDFTINALKIWKTWLNSYFSLSMFFFVLRYGHITHKAHPARIPALKYLFGYKLKKLIRPKYY